MTFKDRESNKGKCFYTNGIIDVMKYECPNGFWKGRVKTRWIKK